MRSKKKILLATVSTALIFVCLLSYVLIADIKIPVLPEFWENQNHEQRTCQT